MKCVEIEEAVARMFGPHRHLIVPNISWGLWMHECDLLVVTKSGYATEVEIKVSRADLRKDFEKRHGHEDRQNRIKRLYYAVPEKLLAYALELVPETAGIIKVRRIANDEPWIDGRLRTRASVVREATKRVNAKPLTVQEIQQVARLGCIRIWGLKAKLIKANGQVG